MTTNFWPITNIWRIRLWEKVRAVHCVKKGRVNLSWEQNYAIFIMQLRQWEKISLLRKEYARPFTSILLPSLVWLFQIMSTHISIMSAMILSQSQQYQRHKVLLQSLIVQATLMCVGPTSLIGCHHMLPSHAVSRMVNHYNLAMDILCKLKKHHGLITHQRVGLGLGTNPVCTTIFQKHKLNVFSLQEWHNTFHRVCLIGTLSNLIGQFSLPIAQLLNGYFLVLPSTVQI